MVNECKDSLNKQNLSENCAVISGVFSKGILIIITDNREFARTKKNQIEGKVLKKEII